VIRVEEAAVMPGFQLIPAGLAELAPIIKGAATAIGEVQGLAQGGTTVSLAVYGHAGLAEALTQFDQRWSAVLRTLAAALEGYSTSTGASAESYENTDAKIMTVSSGGTP
jgi:hypothetical protein